ncbi:hypothetical protein [Serratia fonticola]|uniref:hypothetical protein n=1 Tax=Serratia fonticola TaxID=47917 RepID=UPI0021BD3A4B|nr:hypothetical protein [Serratia fonticola]
MKKPITAMEPQRDEYGHWTHPDFFEPANGMECAAPGEFEAWLDANRVVGHLQWMESDVTDEQLEALEAGDGDISQWNPTPPAGDGWFIGSIHDTEDGPVCYWLRPVEGEPRALADLISRCHVEALKIELLQQYQACKRAAHAYFSACEPGEERNAAGEFCKRIRPAPLLGGGK